MKQIFLILLTCFSLTSFGQPLAGIIASSQNNAITSPSYQNLLKYSEDLSNAVWQKNSITLTNNQEVDLEGNTTLELVNATAITHSIFYRNSDAYSDVVAGSNYIFSFDVKRGTMTEMKYSVYDRTNNSDIVSSTSYYASTSSTVQRISVSFTTPAGCVKASVYPLRDSGVTGTCYIGRLQLALTGKTYTETTSAIAP